MQRVSSNFTIFLKLFIPTFWLVFFGMFTIASLFIENEYNPLFNTLKYKLILSASYLLGALLLLLTLMRLKRVDFAVDSFYVSNYFKTYKYTYDSIASIAEKNYGLFRTIHINLKAKGALGKRIVFLPNYKFLTDFIKDHPEVFNKIEENII